MKRILLAMIATLSLLATIPALSTAASRHGRARGHGVARRHHHHHHRNAVRHERFRPHNSGDSTGAGADTTPSGSAGTVASFQNGVLTITLADGSSVKGMVTQDTDVSCGSTATAHPDATSDTGGDTSASSGDDDTSGTDGNDTGDNGDTGDNSDSQCLALLQQPGTTVVEAELKISQGAASWEKVDLGQ